MQQSHRSSRLTFFVLVLGVLALAVPATAYQRVHEGRVALEGVIIHHKRIGKMGVLYNVGHPFFENFIPATGATPALTQDLEARAFQHGESEMLPASIELAVFTGTYNAEDRLFVVDKIGPRQTFSLDDGQIDVILQMIRARAIATGSEEDRAALDQLIKSGQMREYIFQITNINNDIREIPRR